MPLVTCLNSNVGSYCKDWTALQLVLVCVNSRRHLVVSLPNAICDEHGLQVPDVSQHLSTCSSHHTTAAQGLL